MSTSPDEKQVDPEETKKKEETEETSNLAEDDAELAFFNNKEPSRSDLPVVKEGDKED